MQVASVLDSIPKVMKVNTRVVFRLWDSRQKDFPGVFFTNVRTSFESKSCILPELPKTLIKYSTIKKKQINEQKPKTEPYFLSMNKKKTYHINAGS